MIIVAGNAKLAPGAVDELRDGLRRLVAETRKEQGCINYSIGADMAEEDALVISEMWESLDALKAHMATPHMAEWMKAIGAAGVISSKIRVFDAGAEHRLG